MSQQDMSTHYFPLDTATVVGYVRQTPELKALFNDSDDIEAVEVGDGNLNLVFKLWARADRRRTVVLKQALPYLRLVGESWPLPVDRARIEAQALEMEYRLVPQHTPRLYYFDPVMYLTAMQNLDAHIIMRNGLIKGIKYPQFADHIGLFLARTLGCTSDLVLNSRTKKASVVRFTNPELCKITEDLVFTEPYRRTERNMYHKEIEPQVLALQADDGLRNQVARLRDTFMTQAQALIHGDLHTGSIMVNQTETYVIDPEFATYGPIGFDVGAVIGNLLLSYASHEVRTVDPLQRADFRNYLMDTIIGLWRAFEREFQRAVWDHVDRINMPKGFQENYMLRVFQDSAGMGGCKMVRRVIGLAGAADIRGIEDVTQRSIAASLALNIGQALIMNYNRLGNIEALVDMAISCKPAYPWRA